MSAREQVETIRPYLQWMRGEVTSDAERANADEAIAALDALLPMAERGEQQSGLVLAMCHTLNDADARAERAEKEAAELRGLAEWLLTLDDPEDVIGRTERQTVTLTAIINAARLSLGAA